MNTANRFVSLLTLFTVMLFTAAAAPLHPNTANGGMNLTYIVTPGAETSQVDLYIEPSPGWLQVGFYRAPINAREVIQEITAEDENGQALPVRYSGNNAWQVNAQGTEKVHIAYVISNLVSYQGGLPYKQRGNEVAVYIAKDGGILDGRYFFIVPLQGKIEMIRVKFQVPEGWQVVTPYLRKGEYFVVPQVTHNIRVDFLYRQGIYFGRMKYYAEARAGDAVVRFGKLAIDENRWELRSQQEVTFYAERTAQAVEKYTQIFGENPYPVFAMYTNFHAQGWDYPGTREIVGGYQYWPPGRYDELLGHLLYSWFSTWQGVSPLESNDRMLTQGFGEMYLGNKLAYEITGEASYLGTIYAHYLVYLRGYGTSYATNEEWRIYYKGAVLGLYLDHLIQEATQGQYSLEEVFHRLYQRYKNSTHQVSLTDVQRAIEEITGQSQAEVFQKYVYGNQRIPVEDFIQPYREAFPAFIAELDSEDFPSKHYHGYDIPYFIDVEMAYPHAYHLPCDILCWQNYQQFADYVKAHYDIDNLTEQDVEEALSALTGVDCSGFFTRWEDSYGRLSLEEMKDWLRGKPKESGENMTEDTEERPEEPGLSCRFADPTRAYLTPDTIPIGVPTQVTIHIKDAAWMASSPNGVIKVVVEAWTDQLLGRMLSGVQQHFQAPWENFFFEGGFLPLTRQNGEWTGTLTLTLPQEMRDIFIQPYEGAPLETHIQLCPTLVTPTPTPTPTPTLTSTPQAQATATLPSPASPSPTAGPSPESGPPSGLPVIGLGVVLGMLLLFGALRWRRHNKTG